LNPQINQITLYPNPTDKTITITDKQDQILGSTIAVYTLEGILVFTEKVQSQQHYDLDVSAWRPGTYLMHIHSGTSSKVKKVVVF
jgi:hypothetical protein